MRLTSARVVPRSYRRIQRRSVTDQTSKFNLHNLFKPNEELVMKTNGVAGTGKRDILYRLESMGYSTHIVPFFDYYSKNYQDFNTNAGTAMTQWMNTFVAKILASSDEKKSGKVFKGNVVFMHRSPLSADFHRSTIFPKEGSFRSNHMMDSLNSKFSMSVVYCWCDDIRRMERLGERNYWAQHLNKENGNLLSFFREEDTEIQSKILKEYQEALGSGKIFVGELPTTSSQQATAQLLTMCGLDFGKTVDVSKML